MRDGILLVVLLCTGCMLLSLPFAQAVSSTQNITFQGNGTVFQNSQVDICAKLHIGSCPFYVSAVEKFKGEATAIFVANTTGLAQGQSIPITVNITSGQPTIEMDFVFSVENYSYTYSHPINSYSSLGVSTIENFTIPVANVLSIVSKVLPVNASQFPVHMFATLQSTSTMSAELNGSGFSNNQGINWASPGAQSTTVKLTGSNSTETLYFLPEQTQVWSAGLYMDVPILGPVEVYSIKGTPYQVVGSKVLAATFYRINVTPTSNGTISPKPGARWYVAGQHIEFTSDPNIGFSLVGYFVDGQRVSNATTYNYTADGPTNITAEFAPNSGQAIYAALFQSGGVLGSSANITWVVLLAVLIAALAAWLLLRRNSKPAPAQKKPVQGEDTSRPEGGGGEEMQEEQPASNAMTRAEIEKSKRKLALPEGPPKTKAKRRRSKTTGANKKARTQENAL